MGIRALVFESLEGVFKRHGAIQLDTPVFELRETLMGKYGDEQKLVYDLKDQGGESLSLRYDLTVPLARYVGTSKTERLKRYHIGKVYRRDEPQLNRGRYREFYQCDFDIVGLCDSMLAEVDVISVVYECLNSFGIKHKLKISHRKLLNSLLNRCGVSEGLFKTTASSIDKLDKETWENVKKELIDVKGLDEAVANKIGNFVTIRGSITHVINMIDQLFIDVKDEEYSVARAELTRLEVLLGYVGLIDYIELDVSLARGLDYYTGLIYEAVCVGDEGVSLGSIAAGGRYDGLVGMFLGKSVPAVGVSVGVERVFSIMEERITKGAKNVRQNVTEVLVCNVGGENTSNKRLEILSRLWRAGIASEFMYKIKGNIKKQLDYASELGIPIVVIVGDDEIKQNKVQIRLLKHDVSNNKNNKIENTNETENKNNNNNTENKADTIVEEFSTTIDDIQLEDTIKNIIIKNKSSVEKFKNIIINNI
eukprot:GHVR01017268.1.p1 GENE.GHVR01017268.1~~GHVR01017268.1.p1  ORF type:complete len:479 (+),score=137.37 GHVR01017268.1:710-2146(+)